MCCLHRHLWLCSDAAQGHVFSPVLVAPDLVLGCGVEWWGWNIHSPGTRECGMLVTGVQAAALPSEVWATSGVLFE